MDLQEILSSVNPLPAIHRLLDVPFNPRKSEGQVNEPQKAERESKIVLDIFHETQQKYPKLPTNVLLAMAMDETGGAKNPPSATSSAGAKGLMQQLPAFMKDHKITDPADPSQTIPAAAKEITHNMKVFGNIEDSLAAYNMGRAKLLQYQKKGKELPKETRDYVENISAKLKDLGEGRPPGMPFMQYLTAELIKKEAKK